MEDARPRRTLTVALLVASLAVGGGCASARDDAPDVGLDVDIAAGAAAVPVPGGVLAVHELVLGNTADGPIVIERVTRGDGVAIEGDALLARLVPRSRTADRSARVRLAPRMRSVLLLDAPGAATWTLHVRGTNEHGFEVASAVPATVGAVGRAPVAVGPPLAGAGWVVENGPASISGHRRAILWMDHRPRCAQRFAVDFFRNGPDGKTSRGDGRRNEDHFAYGAAVLACADAVVAAAEDGVPENQPSATDRAVEMTRDTVAGNHVVLDLGGGAFAMYAHLRTGSVRVRAGERVRRGQEIAALGNSGNSTEPHLHFHVADAPSPVDAEGLPWVLDAYALGDGTQRAGELPSEGAVVAFPASSAATGLPSAETSR